MSTLNSSQLYVKRSSTRLHAPPGGHSSLSFGSGGFGTTDPTGSDTKSAYSDPAESQFPSIAGPSRGSTSSYGMYSHPANNQSSDGPTATPPAFHAMRGYAPQAQGLPSSSQGFPNTLPMAMPSENRPASTQSNFSWGERGSQPPLTSSKRDQNWEKKRRLWLARKNGGGGGGIPAAPYTSGSTPLPPPPTASYYESAAVYNPPSPLTKFMAQQTHSRPYSGQGGCDGRPLSSSGGNDYPPPRTANGYNDDSVPPPSSGGSSHGIRQGLASSVSSVLSNGYPPRTAYASPRTSMPGTAYSTAPSTASRRQPPGGSSNWSPYS